MDGNYFVQSLAIFFTSTYFGGIAYQCIVENPARLACNTKALLDEWVGSLKNCQLYFPILLLPSVLFSSIAYLKTGIFLWLVAALLVFSIFPLTGIFLMNKYSKLQDIQKRNIDEENENEVKEIRTTIAEVGIVHSIKALLACIALILSLYIFKTS
jgi:hypothetical protein